MVYVIPIVLSKINKNPILREIISEAAKDLALLKIRKLIIIHLILLGNFKDR